MNDNRIPRLTPEQEKELRAELYAADVLIVNAEDESIDPTIPEMLFIEERFRGDILNAIYEGYKLGLIRGRKYAQ